MYEPAPDILLRPRRRSCYRSRAMIASHHEDSALVAAIASGDRESLGRLYDRYGSQLLALARRFVGDRGESEDLLHDVFVEVWLQARQYEPARGTVHAWLATRVRSRALDRLRALRAAPSESLERCAELSEPGATDDLLLGPDRGLVRRALASLPPEQRRVLELGYFEGLSSSQIAARVDAPIGTVKSRVAAAFAKLRSALPAATEQGGGE